MAEARRTVVIAASQEGIRLAVNGFEAFSAAHHLPPGETWPMLVALDEVLSNVVRHGYRGEGAAGRIEVTFSLRDGEVEMTVIDDAAPFDPLAAADPDTTQPGERRTVGGLGIFFVKKLMDGMTYERREGRNRLSCRRRVRP
jgi:serine/threonine-protein kinase RsbW